MSLSASLTHVNYNFLNYENRNIEEPGGSFYINYIPWGEVGMKGGGGMA